MNDEQRQILTQLAKIKFEHFAFSSPPSYTIRIISNKDNGDQVRTHKKKRTNKKWRKRYGLVSAPLEKGQTVFVHGSNEILMSRKTYRELKRSLKWKGWST